ncbi:hypothetical protein GN244_ATG06769 [Phytophthora infestans]|uniref:FYVE-type domain-containing protein n=1 Tax=Phytophthora infestans TaxID=4787 RepID=A0A833WX86_PHYIN|nr:hypothetical protein GN244_ATG06769 [Phytophthora infestans]
MPKPVAISKFLPALLIPESDRSLLQELAMTLVTHNLEQYNKLCVTKDGHPDSRQWVSTRKNDKIRIYRERPQATGESLPTIPSLLLLGSVVGSLEDVMYGVVAPTDESLKVKSSCIRDGVVDSKVLEEIVRPTMDNPFHHVSLQWRLYNDRDYVTLDTTGITQTPWGERVGYNVSHSVGFPQLPAFTNLGIERGNMSVCSIYSQKANNKVDCYTRGFFELSTERHLHTILALQTIASQWLSLSRNIKCAQMKKLAWRLRKNSDESDLLQLALLQPKQKHANSTCRLCAKSFSFLPVRKRTCKSCFRAVCSRCCVKKLVCAVAPDQCSILEKKRTFCSRCIHEVEHSDAVAIARDELVTLRKDIESTEYAL